MGGLLRTAVHLPWGWGSLLVHPGPLLLTPSWALVMMQTALVLLPWAPLLKHLLIAQAEAGMQSHQATWLVLKPCCLMGPQPLPLHHTAAAAPCHAAVGSRKLLPQLLLPVGWRATGPVARLRPLQPHPAASEPGTLAASNKTSTKVRLG
jgi:hypothetical protein